MGTIPPKNKEGFRMTRISITQIHPIPLWSFLFLCDLLIPFHSILLWSPNEGKMSYIRFLIKFKFMIIVQTNVTHTMLYFRNNNNNNNNIVMCLIFDFWFFFFFFLRKSYVFDFDWETKCTTSKKLYLSFIITNIYIYIYICMYIYR